MLHKKNELTVTQRRPVSTFFNRMIENYERKFDGFPASVQGDPDLMPAAQEGSLNGVDLQKLIDEIANSIIDNETPSCPDTSSENIITNCYTTEGNYDTACNGQSVSIELTLTSISPDIVFTAPFPVDYYVEVYINGLIAVRDVDFEVVNDTLVLPSGTDLDGLSVKARFVVG